MKVTYAMRMPPGDRWKIGNDLFESLTLYEYKSLIQIQSGNILTYVRDL